MVENDISERFELFFLKIFDRTIGKPMFFIKIHYVSGWAFRGGPLSTRSRCFRSEIFSFEGLIQKILPKEF